MALHPFLAAELAAAAGSTPYHRLPVGEARALMKKGYARQVSVPVARVRDFSVPGPAAAIAVRSYHPHTEPGAPLVVFFHGSGFCALDLDTLEFGKSIKTLREPDSSYVWQH